jgi:hypothetical protein
MYHHLSSLIKWLTLSLVVFALTMMVYLFTSTNRIIAKNDIYFASETLQNDESLRKSMNTSMFLNPPVDQQHQGSSSSLRILYIVTSLAEYNTGHRSTEKGSDRLRETIIPVIRESVKSLLRFGFQVDVFLICHWVVQVERLQLLREALPAEVGLQYWDDATPLGYRLEENVKYIQPITRALARQHRFVIKDKFNEYEYFVCFEDDMLVTGDLLLQNIQVSNELKRLEAIAPEVNQDLDINRTSRKTLEESYFGMLTKRQLKRMFPGLMRVEVLLDEEHYPTQKKTGPIPVDLDFENVMKEVNPKYCCHVSTETASSKIPNRPNASQLFIWETNILPLGVRKMPEESTLDWVVMQRGPTGSEGPDIIGDYWSGRNNEFKRQKRPYGAKGNYVNNMGGWMACRDMILTWHNEICPGGFLPPYDSPHYSYDGNDLRNVEYWSGGLHLVTQRHACNMQRIIPLDPESFSKHLIYHTANNKQRQLTARRESYFSKANTLLGQLNSVKKKAEQAIHQSNNTIH